MNLVVRCSLLVARNLRLLAACSLELVACSSYTLTAHCSPLAPHNCPLSIVNCQFLHPPSGIRLLRPSFYGLQSAACGLISAALRLNKLNKWILCEFIEKFRRPIDKSAFTSYNNCTDQVPITREVRDRRRT